jgi:hypothetical protein
MLITGRRRIGRAEPPPKTGTSNWGLGLIDGFLYPLAMVATPLFLLALIVFFLFQAFSDSVGDGIRSFAAVLLPLMTTALLVGFRRDELREKKEALQEGSAQTFPSALAFTLTLLAGIGVLALLVITPTGIPFRSWCSRDASPSSSTATSRFHKTRPCSITSAWCWAFSSMSSFWGSRR